MDVRSQPLTGHDRLSISVVVFRPDLDVVEQTLRRLHQAVTRVRDLRGTVTVLYVVDNSCEAGTFRMVRDLTQSAFPEAWCIRSVVLQSVRNAGYGAGNNSAIACADSDYHLVMNPDVFVGPATLLEALRFLESHPDVGLLVPAVYSEDGRIQYLCKRNPTLLDMFLRGFAPAMLRRVFQTRLRSLEMRDQDYYQEIRPVPYPSGCCMVFRTSALLRVGGFDEGFFMHYEDADIGRRLSEVSVSVYRPEVEIIHKWERGTHKSVRHRWLTVKSAFRYYRKWGGLL